MATSYWQIQPLSGGGYLKVKVLFEGFEQASIPLQNYDRTLGGKASLNVNSAHPYFDTATGLFKIPVTTLSGYATLAQVKGWMTSAVNATRQISVIDDLNITRNMIFISEYRPQSLTVMRDSIQNHWLVPFELHQSD